MKAHIIQPEPPPDTRTEQEKDRDREKALQALYQMVTLENTIRSKTPNGRLYTDDL